MALSNDSVMLGAVKALKRLARAHTVSSLAIIVSILERSEFDWSSGHEAPNKFKLDLSQLTTFIAHHKVVFFFLLDRFGTTVTIHFMSRSCHAPFVCTEKRLLICAADRSICVVTIFCALVSCSVLTMALSMILQRN